MVLEIVLDFKLAINNFNMPFFFFKVLALMRLGVMNIQKDNYNYSHHYCEKISIKIKIVANDWNKNY